MLLNPVVLPAKPGNPPPPGPPGPPGPEVKSKPPGGGLVDPPRLLTSTAPVLSLDPSVPGPVGGVVGDPAVLSGVEVEEVLVGRVVEVGLGLLFTLSAVFDESFLGFFSGPDLVLLFCLRSRFGVDDEGARLKVDEQRGFLGV